MGSLQGFIEKDSITRPTQSVSKLDILDRRASELFFIKAANSLESGPADGAASRPERRSFRVPVLVHEMMEQVSILGHDSCSFRIGVIGTKHRRHVRLFIKYSLHTVDPAWRQYHVRVHEKENVTLSMARAAVARRGRS